MYKSSCEKGKKNYPNGTLCVSTETEGKLPKRDLQKREHNRGHSSEIKNKNDGIQMGKIIESDKECESPRNQKIDQVYFLF